MHTVMNALNSSDLQEIIEGDTKLVVPAGALECTTPPRNIAFYNPKAETNRDVSVIAYSTFLDDFEGPHIMLEPLAGVGARGLRVANEAGDTTLRIYQNDINPNAINLAKKSAELNGLDNKMTMTVSKHIHDKNHSCGHTATDSQGVHASNKGACIKSHDETCNDSSCHCQQDDNDESSRMIFSCNEACRFLSGHTSRGMRGAIVDLDPFGSPAAFFDCATRAVMHGGMISCTATDLQVLNGLFDLACYNRYGGAPIRGTTYGSETAIRLVLGCLRTVAARLDVSIRPLFVSSHMHYYRMYVQVRIGHTNSIRDEIGYVMHCDACGSREIKPDTHARCDACGLKVRVAGPLWSGAIFDKQFVDKMSKKMLRSKRCNVSGEDVLSRHGTATVVSAAATSASSPSPPTPTSVTDATSIQPRQQDQQQHTQYKMAQKLIKLAAEESSLQTGLFYTIDEMASRNKTSPPRISKVIKDLHKAGFAASPTSFAPTGFRTDAPLGVICSVFD